MALIDFSPGLQALGKMFENNIKQQTDMLEKAMAIKKENDLLKFNQIAVSSLSDVTDEKDLNNMYYMLFDLANQMKVPDKGVQTLQTLYQQKTNQIEYNKKEKDALEKINLLKNTNTFKEYNNTVAPINKVVDDLQLQGFSNQQILNYVNQLNNVEKKRTMSYDYNASKYTYYENFASDRVSSQGVGKIIYKKNGKYYFENEQEPITDPTIIALYESKEKEVKEELYTRLLRYKQLKSMEDKPEPTVDETTTYKAYNSTMNAAGSYIGTHYARNIDMQISKDGKNPMLKYGLVITKQPLSSSILTGDNPNQTAFTETEIEGMKSLTTVGDMNPAKAVTIYNVIKEGYFTTRKHKVGNEWVERNLKNPADFPEKDFTKIDDVVTQIVPHIYIDPLSQEPTIDREAFKQIMHKYHIYQKQDQDFFFNAAIIKSQIPFYDKK